MSERDVVRITTAPISRADDLGARQKRYMISMTIRVVCLLVAVLVGPGIFRWLAIAGAVFLPYVAVVMANAEESRTDTFEVDGVGPQHQLTTPQTPPED